MTITNILLAFILGATLLTACAAVVLICWVGDIITILQDIAADIKSMKWRR